MKKGKVITLILGALISFYGFAKSDFAPGSCVLNFEKKNHPFSSKLNGYIAHIEIVHLVHGALPTDILKCLDAGVSKILIIGHAGDLGSNKQTSSPLLYFKELKGEKRKEYINRLQMQLNELEKHLEARYKWDDLSIHDELFYFDVRDQVQRIDQLPEDFPIYDQPKILENNIFKQVLKSSHHLKKLSIVSCLPEKVAAFYPELKELSAQGIEVKFAPKNQILSFIRGKNVTSPDFDWIIKEITD
ncbi:MAG: hypothetical protein AB7I27_14360 [Bacteriovoracaceae bacterium]